MEVLKKNNLWSHRTNRLKKYEFLLHYRFLTCPYPLFNCLHWHLNLATLSLSLLFCMACRYLHVSSWQFDNFCRCRSSSLSQLFSVYLSSLVSELGGLGYFVKYPSPPSSDTKLDWIEKEASLSTPALKMTKKP